jgi:hypothetical protein
LKNCWKLLLRPVPGLLLIAAANAQMAPTLSVAPLPTVKAKKGSDVVVTLKASLPVTYPKAELEKYSFSDKPISVVTGEFSIATKFKVPAGASNGPAAQTGTLRYQACDNKACYPPKTLPVNVTVSVE